MSHTPGPWEWDGNVCNYDPENEAPWLVGAGDDIVLTGEIECKSEANACLIAAAPDLLAALEGMISLYSDIVTPDDEPEVIAAYAARAKARGG